MRALLLTALLATVPLLYGCAGGEGPAATATSPKGSTSRGRRGAELPSPGDLDLAAMVAPVPEYEGSGRNLFIYGPERRATPRPQPQVPVAEAAPAPRPQPRAARPTSARLNVKYAGFVEKTGADGAKAKYAIFLDGNEILAGAEGETVANRFKVVEIGLESVTVAAAGSETTERIPLQSN